jgi:hypothetical protein
MGVSSILWLPQTSGTHIRESRRFKSMYTLQGKTWSIRHTLSTLNPRRVPDHTSHVVHVGILLLVPMRIKHTPTPEKSLSDQRQTDSTVVFGHLILPPSWQPWSRGERFWPSGYIATSTYWTHVPVCDGYIQCLLTGANPSVLNWHRRGLQPWRCRLSTYHSLFFPTDDLHFPPKGPAQSQVKQSNITKRYREGTNPKSHEWEPQLEFYQESKI